MKTTLTQVKPADILINHIIKPRWRLIVIISVLGFSFAIPYIPQSLSQLLLLGIIGFLIVILFLRRPPLGLLSLIAVSLLIKFGLSTGSQTPLNLTTLLLFLLLGLWFLDMIARRRKIEFISSRPLLPLLLFLLSTLLSFIGGQSTILNFAGVAPITAQIGGLAIVFLSAGAFLLVAHQIREIRWLQYLVILFLLIGGLYIAGRIFLQVGTITSKIFAGGSSGSIFWVWLVAITLGQILFNSRLELRWRLLLIGLFIATFYVSYGQTSRWKSGWLPPLVVVTTLLVLRYKYAIFVLAIVSLAFVPSLVQDLISSDIYSYSTRLEAWQIIIEIVKANPITGLGPANYYWYTPLFPIRGFSVTFNSHNNYVDIFAQFGILGLVFFSWFAFELARLGWSLRERVSVGFSQAYVYTALAGLVGTLFAGMLGDWFLPFVYNVGLVGFRASVFAWIFLGGLLAIEQITLKKSSSIAET